MPRARATSRQKAQPVLTPRIKVWLEVDGNYVFGFGIAQILQAVDHTGSIKAAAAQLGKSYRHIWSRIKEAETAIGFELIDSQVGGAGVSRSFLTAEAKELLASFTKLREDMKESLRTHFTHCRTDRADSMPASKTSKKRG